MISIVSILIFFLFILVWLFYTRLNGAEYFPTTPKKAKKMIEFANITKKDYVYDLGCGFGGLIIKAAKTAKKAIGIEYDPLRYWIGKTRAKILGLKNIEFVNNDFFKQNMHDADVVFLFLRQKTNQKLKPKLKNLKKGTRIITNTWTFNKWRPLKQDKKLKVYLYKI